MSGLRTSTAKLAFVLLCTHSQLSSCHRVDTKSFHGLLDHALDVNSERLNTVAHDECPPQVVSRCRDCQEDSCEACFKLNAAQEGTLCTEAKVRVNGKCTGEGTFHTDLAKCSLDSKVHNPIVNRMAELLSGAPADLNMWEAIYQTKAGHWLAQTKADQDLTSFLEVGAKKKQCKNLVFLSDLEGNFDAWGKFLRHSGAFAEGGAGIEVAAPISGKFALNEGYCLVYGGDTLDSSFNSDPEWTKPVEITKNLVQLSSMNPGRVVLLLGNRDLNKLRLKAELNPDTLPENYRYYWVAANRGRTDTTVYDPSKQTAPTWTPDMTPGERLQQLMKESMGASMDGIRGDLVASGLVEANDDKTAEYIRDTLLSPDAPGNWYYQYLQKGVLLAAASIGDKFALFSHTGVHPLMMQHGKYLMVPTAAGLMKESKKTWHPDNLDGLDFNLKTEDRVTARRDDFQYSKPGWNIKKWVQEYAAWKASDFQRWSDIPSAGFTAANRPGVQLIDAGVGNLAGVFRNAGFTTGGPCSAWEYGVNYGGLYESETFGVTPKQFGNYLSDNFGVAYLFNGHFTEPKNALPLRYSMGPVMAHNHDLTKAPSYQGQASFSRLDGLTGFSETHSWDTRQASFRTIASDAGEVYAVKDIYALQALCQPTDPGFEMLPLDPQDAGFEVLPTDASVWWAYVQDREPGTHKVLKLLPKKGVVLLGKAMYCVLLDEVSLDSIGTQFVW